MAPPDIPTAKRTGLAVDLDRLTAEGDGWLTAEDRYALKTFGVCTQAQPGVFMVRCRVPAGVLSPHQAVVLADLAEAHGFGWLHLTTRQNVELHHVPARQVAAVLAAVDAIGLTNRSSCGHTMRNVMACPDAGVGLDEPFDCRPDARLVSDAILARSAELNCVLPSRINISFGGCRTCTAHARINDAGFESRVVNGVAGYRLWAAGSLGTAPALAVELADFVPRDDALAAAEALVEVFVAHGDFEHPKRGRMKFVVDDMGVDAFVGAFHDAFACARRRPHPQPEAIEVLGDDVLAAILGVAPVNGWGDGIRPQRTRGLAMVTVNVPLGDLDAADMRLLADLALAGDGRLHLTRNQNVMFRDVPVGAVPSLRRRLSVRRLSPAGADSGADVRSCTGSAVCALAIAAAPAAGATLLSTRSLARNSGLRVHVSGCPNSCAQHQAADIGLSGAKVRINGRTRLGYHVWVGADLEQGRLGTIAGRVAEEDVALAVDGLIGTYEALRWPGEAMAATVHRLGVDAFAAQVAAVADRFEPGAEPEPASGRGRPQGQRDLVPV